jgi:hypothetical protein
MMVDIKATAVLFAQTSRKLVASMERIYRNSPTPDAYRKLMALKRYQAEREQFLSTSLG